MEGSILYNIPHQLGIQANIAWYFLLTGLNTGSSVYLIKKKEFKLLGLIAAYLAPLLIIAAPVLLIIDAGKPLRVWNLFITFNPGSPISWGSWLLMVYPVVSLLYLWHLRKGNEKMLNLFGAIGIALAVLLHGYAGFVLAMTKLSPLWNNALMTVFLLISAMVSELGLIILVAVIIRKMPVQIFKKLAGSGAAELASNEAMPLSEALPLNEMLNKTGKILSGFIAFNLFLIFAELTVLLTESREAYALAMNILTGSFSFLFIGVVIILGSLIPLLLLLHPKTARTIAGQALASALVIIGAVAIRYFVVIGGQSVPFN